MPGLTRQQIMALVPHGGAMCLLDRVIGWDPAGIHCRSEQSHLADDHPLRHNNRLAAVNLIEYGAQAAAVHAGLLASASGEPQQVGGFLAALRDVELAREPVDAALAPLEIRARREVGGPRGMIYHFAVYSRGGLLSSGRLTIAGAA